MGMTSEAVLRLRKAGSFLQHDKAVEEHYLDGKVTVTLCGGDVYDIDSEALGSVFTTILSQFEAEYPGYHVYHMVETGGPMLAILYVGPNEDEWDEEKIDDDGNVFCYVYNALYPYYSEFGSACIDLYE